MPTASQTPACQAGYDDCLSYISDITAHSLHFFDESPVTKTSGKRKYGSSVIGKRAFEIQPYTSNANYTISFLQSAHEIDYFDILDSPSN